MSRVDVVQLRGSGVRSAAGAALAFLTGSGPGTSCQDPDGELLFRVDKQLLDDWYARRPDGEAVLRIDWSISRFHPVTYADGRTGRFDAAPELGAWQLTDDVDGRLVVHARGVGNALTDDWECAQDGSLTLLDFLATVVTYRELRRLRRRHIDAAGALS